MNFSDGISQTALATQLNISRVHVRRLIDKGVFVADDSKRVSLSAAKKAYAEHQNSVDKNKRNKSRKTALNLINDLKETSSNDNFDDTYKKWLSEIDIDPITVLNSAKAYLTALQVQEQKMKVDEMEKRLIPIERINHDAEEIGTLIRSKLITIPSRVATVCEGRTARDIEEIIDIEINKALEELQKLFVQL